ncbi:MAG: glycosyl hydrolase 115 family protein, partial [Muribaculaceae bacterium]|nr:glycosyl hydrolase 115 family protein [Muribaculaceae bacterium]
MITSQKGGHDILNLTYKSEAIPIYIDTNDFEVVRTASNLLASDVEAVTTIRPDVKEAGDALQKQCVIAGTIGKNDLINRLHKAGKIDLSLLNGGWEQYLVQLVEKPFPGVDKALVIVGSDRRGTAYGLLSISRAIGVSPWYWWLDAPTVHKDRINLKVTKCLSKEPSVKYRGIFINDEDWGLYQWAAKNFEKERGNIGPRTYEKVCELLLRLQANYLCPAMHNCSAAFHSIPENREVADRYGIVTGSSHCEPLMLNTATEWHRNRYGEWDYENNRSKVDSVLNARAAELAPYENVYTLALRGLHDSAMSAGSDMKERMKLLQEALMSQRNMVAEHTGQSPEHIPMAFTPYKEVLDVYDQGLELPDDVTIIWPDDNYGYMKRLSSVREQQRSGRSGVYYHASYLGKPHDHLWMHTASPTVMYEELRKAYDQTADRIWLLNSGNIKSCEFAVDLFLTMAYDIDAFNFERAASYRTEWLCGMLGDEHKEEFADVCDAFYRLAFSRRPEFMGWGYEWSADGRDRERNTDTDFSLDNYREVDRRLDEYRRIGNIVSGLLEVTQGEKERACLYQALYYPVKGCELLNRMVLDGQRNRRYASEGRASARKYASYVKESYDSLETITNGYNSLLEGKWDHIMSMRQGVTAAYYEMPNLYEANLKTNASLGLKTEEEDGLRGRSSYRMLPCFNTFYRRPYYIDVFNRGASPLEWALETSDPWIITDCYHSSSDETRVDVSIDWENVPVGENVRGYIDIKATNGDKERVYISVFNPSDPLSADLDSLYVENNGYVAIDAAGFHRKKESQEIKMTTVPYMGCENYAVQIGDPAAPQQRTAGRETPCLEYDFYTFDQGSVDVYTYVLPTFTLNNDRGYAGHESTNAETKYGICVDDGPVMNPSTSSVEYAQIWYESALKNSRINKTTLHINRPGKHTIKVICGDAGTVIQKIILDFGGLKRSY